MHARNYRCTRRPRVFDLNEEDGGNGVRRALKSAVLDLRLGGGGRGRTGKIALLENEYLFWLLKRATCSQSRRVVPPSSGFQVIELVH